jgi:hypothetical protein
MQVNDPRCTTDFCGTQVGGTNGTDPFTFSSNDIGGGAFSFHISVDVTTLDIETPGTFPVTTDVSCTSNVFATCDVSFLGGVTDIFLSNQRCFENCLSGIPTSEYFTIVLNDDLSLNTQGKGGWGPDRPFTAEANLSAAPTTALISAPEPSSLLLLATGAVTLAGRRKFRTKKA